MVISRQLGGTTTVLGVRLVAIIEAVLLLAAIIVIDAIGGSGDRFWHVRPHPFWIVVLLIAAQYGAREGLFAAVAASLALLVANLPPMGFGEDPYDYAVGLALNPAMWLAASLVIGELRSQADRRVQEMERSLKDSEARENHLAGAAERLATANRALEERVAGQLRTVASLYEASRAVEQLGAGDVLVGIAGLVRAGLNPSKFSLYLLNQDQLEAVLNEGWGPHDKYTRVFGPTSPLFREIVVNRRPLCVANAPEQAVLGSEGMLAGPIVSAETGETLGMLKVERMEALDFNMSAVESFRIMCAWIGTAFARARTFEHAASRSFIGAGGILSAGAEPPLTSFLKSLSRRARFDLSAVNVSVHMPGFMTPDQRMDVLRALRTALVNSLRQTDIACERSAGSFDFVVLAPACSHAEARRLAEKLKLAIEQSLPIGGQFRVSAIAVPLIEEPRLEVSA